MGRLDYETFFNALKEDLQVFLVREAWKEVAIYNQFCVDDSGEERAIAFQGAFEDARRFYRKAEREYDFWINLNLSTCEPTRYEKTFFAARDLYVGLLAIRRGWLHTKTNN